MTGVALVFRRYRTRVHAQDGRYRWSGTIPDARLYPKQSQIRATERDIGITGLETCVIEGNFDWNIVEIHTNVCTDSLTTAAWAS